MKADRAGRQVVMVGTSFETMGGISSVVNGYVEQGFLEKHGIRYVVLHRDGTAVQKLRIAVAGIFRLLRICAAERNLLVHIHLSSRASFWRKSICCLICRVFGHPYILHVHGSEFMEFYSNECGPMAKRFVAYTLSGAARILALSDSWRQNLLTIAPDARIEVVPNAVPLIDRDVPPADHRPIVLFLGRLGVRKGVMELIRAFATVAADFPRVDLVCAGDGDIEGAKRLARELGLEDRVRCPGWIRGDQKMALMRDAIVFALPSHAEGLPMAILEAMAAGLPVLATHVGGIPEVVRHGVEGYLFEPGDVEAMSRHLRTLLEDDAARLEIAQNARRRIEASYSLPPILERLESIYQSIP